MGEQDPSIKSASRLLRPAALLALTVALLAGHGVILQLLAAHTSLSLAVVSALSGLVVIKHLGLFGAAYAALRRYLHHNR
jgi:Na+/H+ antiporter NhaA